MVFDRLLKRDDVEFDIKLLDNSNGKYEGGQKVKGYLTILSKRETKVSGLRLIAEGIESTRISVSERSSLSSSSHANRNTSSTTKREANTFFSIELSEAIQKLYKKHDIKKDNGMVLIESGTKETPFEFTIPTDAYPSYNGRHATVSYHVKATADRDNWFDKNKTVSFMVIGSKPNKPFNQTTIADEINEGYESPLNTTQTNQPTAKDNGGREYYGTPRRKFNALSYVSMIGEGKINIDLTHLMFSAKDKSDFTKESEEAKVQLFPKESGDKNPCCFSPGEKIRGDVIVIKDLTGEKVNNVEVSINGIEYAYAAGYERITQMERYAQKVNIKMDDSIEEEDASNTKYNENNNTNGHNNLVVPFEIQVPETANRSYAGKHSEYFWGLDSKIDIGLSKDLHTKKLIEVS